MVDETRTAGEEEMVCMCYCMIAYIEFFPSLCFTKFLVALIEARLGVQHYIDIQWYGCCCCYSAITAAAMMLLLLLLLWLLLLLLI